MPTQPVIRVAATRGTSVEIEIGNGIRTGTKAVDGVFTGRLGEGREE